MSFNGSGTFNVNTAGQPVVTGTVISSSVFNALTADLATGLSTCITKDGQTTVTANIPMNSFKFTGLAAGTAATDSVRLGQLQAGAATLITVTGTNTYSGTMTPALSAYAAGNTFSFLVPNTNTTSCTLNIDGLGAKSITRDGTTALVAGDLVANSEVVVVYDGTQFQVLNSNSKTNFNLSGTLTVAGNTTLSGGTANGVAYLNASKVLTTGSALTFDGSTLTATTTSGIPLVVTGTGSVGARIVGGTGAGAGAYINLQAQGGNAGLIGTEAAILGSGTSTNLMLYGYGSNSIVFAPATVEGMRLTSTGLGIGTSSPGAKLDVNGNVQIKAGGYELFLNSDNTNYYYLQNTGATGSANAKFEFVQGGAGTRLTLDSSGNLGIGTSSPNQRLEVYGASSGASNTYIRLTANIASGYEAGLQFFRNGGSIVNAQIAAVTEIGNDYGRLMFSTANAGTLTERMRLDSSGNLGLGVTPSASTIAQFEGGANLILVGRGNVYASNNATFNSGWKYISTAVAAQYNISGAEHRWFNAASGTAGTAITFTQAMTLDASGNLLVGTTSSYGGPGRINVGFNQSTNFGITLRNTSATATGVFVSFENSGGTGNGSISQTNSTTVAYNTSSDRRLKKNIAPAPQAGTDIDAIKIVSHGWVSNDDIVKYGVVAQDLQSIVPQAVTAGDDGDEIERVWGVDYSKLVPMLIKEIQSLRQRVAQLEVK